MKKKRELMKVMLTGSLGGMKKEAGKRVPFVLIEKSGLLSALKSIWPQNANIVVICTDHGNYEKNDIVTCCQKESFPMSGLPVKSIAIWDDRKEKAAEDLTAYRVIVLTGGYVPTQKCYFRKIQLKERISDYKGIVVAWSAGSMNCAELVSASPEMEGEAIDPLYERWISGLGLTSINIFPHYQRLKDETLDSLRLIEEITFADSIGHEFIALNDGSYIMIDNGQATLFGEAYRIKDAEICQICKDNKSLVLN